MLEFFSTGDVPADFGPSVVTIGKFDGVHAGHRAVVARLVSISAERGLTSVVVTFDRNPLSLVAPERCPEALGSNAQKLELLTTTGVEATLLLPFTEQLAAQSAEQFVRSILAEVLHTAVLLVGADFRFGAGGAGDVALLRQLGSTLGFEVEVIDDVAPTGGRRVSSTWIRDLLGEGRVAEAAELLGSLPSVRATVVHGFERGRLLGYPTANLASTVEGYVPADGVYAAWLTASGVRYPAAVSVGTNPTFGDVTSRQIEAHVIDETLDLYDQTVDVSFVTFIRGMQKFADAAALAQQMGDDERRIRQVLDVD